jgi:hypothetical protein
MEEPAEDVLRFIADRIDTVPEIEALLLLWEQRPTAVTVPQLAHRLFVSEPIGAAVIRALEQRRFAMQTADGSQYAYDSAWEPDSEFMVRVATTYRRHLIRVTTLIHSKASPAVLEFARAFEPKKDT